MQFMRRDDRMYLDSFCYFKGRNNLCRENTRTVDTRIPIVRFPLEITS
jgi:hypothetical protein